jgi:hypothetical protein
LEEEQQQADTKLNLFAKNLVNPKANVPGNEPVFI